MTSSVGEFPSRLEMLQSFKRQVMAQIIQQYNAIGSCGNEQTESGVEMGRSYYQGDEHQRTINIASQVVHN